MDSNLHDPNNGDFYNLTPREFAQLVATVLSHSPGFSDVLIATVDQGVDILAKRNGNSVGIEVKHKTHISTQDIQQLVYRHYAHPAAPRDLILVTSAEVSPDIRSSVSIIPRNGHFEIIDRNDLRNMLSNKTTIQKQYELVGIQRLKSQRKLISIGLIAGIFSILGTVLPIFIEGQFRKAPLDKRIETVENALRSMRDLETYLDEIKRDMLDTQKATELINEKYSQAKELEKLTAVQIAALQSTLQVRNWWWTALNYLFAFVLGIASSLIATVLHARWKQRKAIE